MSEDSTIAPWAHPKAHEWFETIFDRSGVLLRLSEEIYRDSSQIELPQIRLFASLLILLGRDGIWPASQKNELIKMADRLSELLRGKLKAPRTAMTMDEHKLHGQLVAEAEHEVELLRRMVGISRRLNKLGQPTSWKGFWNA
jgi:hypothetical protein